MQTEFFDTPFRGVYHDESAPADEVPIRNCLIIAFDDHSECYLVVDRETGRQSWRGVNDVQIDCAETLKALGEEEKPKGPPCPMCHRPTEPEEDD